MYNRDCDHIQFEYSATVIVIMIDIMHMHMLIGYPLLIATVRAYGSLFTTFFLYYIQQYIHMHTVHHNHDIFKYMATNINDYKHISPSISQPK